MKKTMKFFSMAALGLMGAIMTGCSSDDNIIDNPQQPENKSNVVTLTTTVGLDGGTTTRALTSDGVKTFAVNDQIAVVYKKKTGGATAVAVSEKLKSTDITNSNKSATFTVTLDDPDNSEDVTYVYPAAMAKADGTINYDALDTQNGTLTTLESSLDLATYTGAWNGTSLPTATLANQLAILAITLKDNAATPTEITGNITGLTVSDGTNTYTVTRAAAAGPIYVAIHPTSSATIEVTATDGTKNYGKFLSAKTYAANNGYSVSWKMLPVVDLSTLGGTSYNVTEDCILTGTPANSTFTINAQGHAITLDNVNSAGAKSVAVEDYSNNLNVYLKGTSRLKHLAAGNSKALSIDEAVAGGTVILIDESAGPLGGNYASSVTINGGTVKAKTTNSFGQAVVLCNLTINGGAVYLQADGSMGPSALDMMVTVSGSVTLYVSDGSSWVAWSAYSNKQYASTDNSAAPSSWTW